MPQKHPYMLLFITFIIYFYKTIRDFEKKLLIKRNKCVTISCMVTKTDFLF